MGKGLDQFLETQVVTDPTTKKKEIVFVNHPSAQEDKTLYI